MVLKTFMSNEVLSLDVSFLFPRTMSTYGDNGNILSIKKRCDLRNIEVKIHYTDIGDEFYPSDIYFWGGGQDKAQQVVSASLDTQKIDFIKCEVENNKNFLLICGSYQLMGNYYIDSNNTRIPGLGVLDLYTQSSKKRMIGNTIIEINDPNFNFRIKTIVGFENHSGMTFLNKDLRSFGFVKHGYGNNGIDKTEGVIYKNVIGCYQHGPLLPKNPHLADYIILKALRVKYPKSEIKLADLDDTLEYKAHYEILKKIK